MKHIVYKLFWNYEKEEAWLNKMSAMGLAMTDYSWCKYVFADTPENEYIYRIELLDELPAHPESVAYIRFMEENGVEHISSYARWVYFRKKSSEGTFDIYSDIESKIKHYNRIHVFWSTIMFVELTIGLSNITIGMSGWWSGHGISLLNLIVGVVLILLGLVFLKGILGIRKKMKKLQQEKMIRE